MLMDCAICVVPAAPVRRKPSHKWEMVNQLLFGEGMRILKIKNKWVRVQTAPDNYEGWIRSNMITHVEDSLLLGSFVTAGLLNTIIMAETTMHIPFGSTLPAWKNGEGVAGKLDYRFEGPVLNRNEIKPSCDLVRHLT